MARPKASGHDQNRAIIRGHAVAAFARLGYASASMADLAQACTVSKATLYHYFQSKDTLLFECLDDYTIRLLALTEQRTLPLPTDSAQAQEQLRHLIRDLLAEYAQSHNYHVSLLKDVKFLGGAERDKIQAQERAIVLQVAHLIDAAFPGRIDAAHRTTTTMALLGMINFTFAWLKPDGPMSYEQFADIVIDLWFNGLKHGPLDPVDGK